MKVNSVTTTPDAYRQTQYYAGEHLAYYYDPTDLKNRAQVVTKVENGIFTRYLQKESGLRDLISTSSTKEQQFFERRKQLATNEELLHKLNYMNGVHYSAANLNIK